MPNLGRLVARESELQGFYRTAQNRLTTNSEEVAFYDGSQKEKTIINNALQMICQHIAYARYVKAWIAVFDGLLIKYYASIAGYCTLLSPFILNMNSSASTVFERNQRLYETTTKTRCVGLAACSSSFLRLRGPFALNRLW